MRYFKDQGGGLYCIPDGCVEVPDEYEQITEEEYLLLSSGGYQKPNKVTVVTRFQARAALYQAGLLEGIEAFISDPSTDFFTKLAWQDAQEFRRDSPLVTSIGLLVGLTSNQLDDLFMFASTISA